MLLGVGMIKVTAAALACVLALSGTAMAADLIVDDAVIEEVDTGFVNSVYFQVLGGASLGGAVAYSFGDEFDLDAGYAVAGAIGVVVMDGLSVELDVFHAKRNYELSSDAAVATTSLMGNVKYTAELTDMFSLYGAAGLGIIHLEETEPGEVDSADGFGYQLIVGLSAEMTENIALIGEFRYQNSFDGLEFSDSDVSVDVPTAAALIGAKLSF